MTPKHLIILAALGSAALLAGAFVFQQMGYAPCKLCLWQRWPHAAAAGVGVVTLIVGTHRLLALAGGTFALITAGVGGFHMGVEFKWWDGPKGCTGFDITELSPAEAMEAIMGAQLVRCDEVSWAFLGLSMPGWNMVLSLVLAGIWFVAARRAQK